MIAGVVILVVTIAFPLWIVAELFLVGDPWRIGRTRREFLRRNGPT